MKRMNIGIFGRVNSGKSTLMNLITQQYLSIVDSTPSTTTDVKTTIMEIHDFGPAKIFDTAGVDEKGASGLKKKEKSFDTLKRSDIVLLVINESNNIYNFGDYNSEKEIIELAQKKKKEVFIIINKFDNIKNKKLFNFEVLSTYNISKLEINLSQKENYKLLINFLIKNSKVKLRNIELLPILEKDKVVFLNIPMDEETPNGRFLRPQMMIEEYLVRKYIPTFAYRMDLIKARSQIIEIQEAERLRFMNFIKYLKRDDKLQLLITDSQAMDVIAKWTKYLDIDITTFSIVMINFLSNGQLNLFIDGIKAFEKLKRGDKIMIVEACNHDRKAEDIGTIQIPNKINEILGKDNIKIEHYFGRVFAEYEKLKEYKLIIHCDVCMLDSQVIKSRIEDLVDSGVSFTNFGVLLSYFQGKKELNRVIKPYGLKI